MFLLVSFSFFTLSYIVIIYPSVAFLLCFIIQGFPNTTESLGISQLTYELGAIKTLLPIFTLPTIVALTPIQTLSPNNR